MNKYEDYRLTELVNFKKISINKNPILFLLDLIDSIDPVKYFDRKTNLNVFEILKSISIDFDKHQLKFIIFLSDSSNINNEIFGAYIKYVKDLEKWLDIAVDDSASSLCRIEIKTT